MKFDIQDVAVLLFAVSAGVTLIWIFFYSRAQSELRRKLERYEERIESQQLEIDGLRRTVDKLASMIDPTININLQRGSTHGPNDQPGVAAR